MKVIDPGHAYELNWLDGQPIKLEWINADTSVHTFTPNSLIFVKREGEGYPGNAGHHPGTNIQEVLRALIDRVKYLDGQIRHERNDFVLGHLRAALYQLEMRAAERHGQKPYLSGVDANRIEDLPTCVKCGHIGCDGVCHP